MIEPLKIGSLEIMPPILAAPMSGLSDRAYRRIAREMGCLLAFTEMISAEGLARNHRNTWALVDTDGEDGLVGVQLFGCDPERLALAASRLVERSEDPVHGEDIRADVIDINMGCPVAKVVRTGAGAALLRDVERIKKIAVAVRTATCRPVTVKLRSGWERRSRACLEIARILEGEGIDALTLHPRSYEDGFSGKADWPLLAELKQSVSIPVIGSGDVFSASDACRMMRETGCDAVMIARGMVGNPWIIRHAIRSSAAQIPSAGQVQEPASATAEGEHVSPEGGICAALDWHERVDMILHHARLVVDYKGEERGLRQFRKQLLAYLHGVRGARYLKADLMKITRYEQLQQTLEKHKAPPD